MRRQGILISLLTFVVLAVIVAAAITLWTIPPPTWRQQYQYGVFYDSKYHETIQYRVDGETVEIFNHGKWVNAITFDNDHIILHMDNARRTP